MPADLQLTVVVVTHRSAAVLGGCLAALRDELPSLSGGIELVVVDNDSPESPEDAVREVWPEATVLHLGRNAGYAAGVNAALAKRSGTGPLLVLNPDVRTTPGSLTALLDALESPGTGIAVPRMTAPDGSTSPSLRRRPTALRAWGQALLGARADRFAALSETVPVGPRYEVEHGVDWATGAAVAVAPRCLEALGGWDESFFLYSEETDYCLRARDHGLEVRYVPGATVMHIGGESGTNPLLWTVLTLNRVRLARRRLGRLRGAWFRSAVVVGEAVRAAAGRQTSRAALDALVGRAPEPELLRQARAAAAEGVDGDAPVNAAAVVCFSAQDFWYHNRAHSDVQLMTRLARDRDVLLVNSIGMRMPLPGRSSQPLRRIARKVASTAKLLRHPLPGLPRFAVLSPLVLPLYGSPAGRALNARAVALQVRLACRLLHIARPTAVVTIPTAVDVLPHLAVDGVVFNRSDKHSEFEETDQDSIRAMEDRLLRESDAVVYVSRELMRQEADRTGDRAVFLDHGVDLDHFSPAGRGLPADLPTEGPRVGFFGGIDAYVVDLDLLERVARELPQAQVVIVGDATCSMDALTTLPNVTWLGFRPYEEIPSYGRGFDVALMPWLDNDWIRSCNPIKLKEYLALGLPIVSTDFPEVRHYESVIRVAHGHEDFVSLVRQTLEDGGPATPEIRRAAVAGSSWDEVTRRLSGTCASVRRR